MGFSEYMSNSNNNTDHIPTDMKFKFVDDLSALELLNLILIGLSSYNFKNHDASDIGIDQLFLPSENNKSQETLNKIEEWTISLPQDCTWKMPYWRQSVRQNYLAQLSNIP